MAGAPLLPSWGLRPQLQGWKRFPAELEELTPQEGVQSKREELHLRCSVRHVGGSGALGTLRAAAGEGGQGPQKRKGSHP